MSTSVCIYSICIHYVCGGTCMCIYRICVLIYVDLRICIYVCTYTVYMYTGYILL